MTNLELELMALLWESDRQLERIGLPVSDEQLRQRDELRSRIADALRKDDGRQPYEQRASLAERLAEAETQNKWMRRALKSIADETYDPWTNGAEAGRLAGSIIESLQTRAYLKGNDK